MHKEMVTTNTVVVAENSLTKTHFDALGICCSSEVPLIEKILKPLEGVVEVSVVVPTRTIVVVHDSLLISEQQIGMYLRNLNSIIYYHLIISFIVSDI